jgi:glycosyltransferase involved in cell wall biosynthesis
VRVLFLTDNFPPETNAPASRTYEHAKRWVAAGCEVTVVTCAPNFPVGRVFPGYRNRPWQWETLDGIRVLRVWSYIAANKGFARRTLDYLSFMISSALASLFVARPDVVVATSPQFFTACAGWAVGALRRVPFVMEVRDLWPESIVAVGAMKETPAIALLRRLEYFLYRKAARIVSLTYSFRRVMCHGGILESKVAVVRNGADLADFFPGPKPADLVAKYALEGKFVVGYIGTIGMAHGLGTLLECAEILRADERVRFLVVGDGAEREFLEHELTRRGLSSVVYAGSVDRREVIRYWQLLDVAAVMLRDLPVFRTVLPSKIFEAMATARPIILGVRGEAEQLVAEAAAGLCIAPEDSAALAAAVRELADSPVKARALGESGRAFVESHLNRDHLAMQMLEELRLATR